MMFICYIPSNIPLLTKTIIVNVKQMSRVLKRFYFLSSHPQVDDNFLQGANLFGVDRINGL